MKIYKKILLSVLLSTSFSFSAEDKENIDFQIRNKENEIKELKKQVQNDAAKIIALKWKEQHLKRRMNAAACDIQNLNNKKAKIIYEPSFKRDTDIVAYDRNNTVNSLNPVNGSIHSLVPYSKPNATNKPSGFEGLQHGDYLNSSSTGLVPYDYSRTADLASENRLVPYSGNSASGQYPQYRLNPSLDISSSNYKTSAYHSPAGDLIPFSGKDKYPKYTLNDVSELEGRVRSNFEPNSVAYDFDNAPSIERYKKASRIGNGSSDFDGRILDAEQNSSSHFSGNAHSMTSKIAFTIEQLELLRPYVERLDKKTIYHYIVDDTLRALVPQRDIRGNHTGFKEVTVGTLDNTQSKESELLFKVSDAIDVLIYPNRQHMSAKLVYLGMHTIGLNNFTPKCCPGEQFQFKFIKRSDVLK